MAEIPNPGTQEAIDQYCKCPVIDNGYGRGYHWAEGRPQVFMYSGGCELHKAIFNELFRQGAEWVGGATPQ